MSSDIARRLSGKTVRVWPYAQGVFPRAILYQVWQAIEAERAWNRVMWFQPAPDAQKGDLASFAAYMQDKIPLLVQSLRLEHQPLCGIVWFDEYFVGLRANLSIWFQSAVWGAPAQEAGEIATWYGHQVLKCPVLWGISPWKAAKDYAVKCGWRHVVTLPRYVWVNGKAMPMHYCCHEEPLCQD